jgi:hypothetical protein
LFDAFREATFGAFSRGPVCFEDVRERFDRALITAREHGLYELRYLWKSDIAAEKSCDCNFVCRVQDRRR